jgi:hypothetical protein
MQQHGAAAREHPDNAEMLAWFAKEDHEEIIEPASRSLMRTAVSGTTAEMDFGGRRLTLLMAFCAMSIAFKSLRHELFPFFLLHFLDPS